MGFKSLMLLITLVFIAIFSIQNLQSISLVFFGFTSLALPLSVWIIISLLAGIISSLVIQLLSNSFGGKNSYRQSFSSQSPPDYPPSPSVTEKVSRQEKRQTVSSSPVSPSLINNMPSEDDFNVFDHGETEYSGKRQQVNDNIFINEKPLTSPSTNINSSSSLPEEVQEANQIPQTEAVDLEKETTSDDNVSLPPQEKLPKEEIPSTAWLKSREASLYSYQPKEKTTIKTTTSQVDKDKNKRGTNSSASRNINGIYDAPYRVISPGKNNLNQDDDLYWDDEDEDWV